MTVQLWLTPVILYITKVAKLLLTLLLPKQFGSNKTAIGVYWCREKMDWIIYLLYNKYGGFNGIAKSFRSENLFCMWSFTWYTIYTCLPWFLCQLWVFQHTNALRCDFHQFIFLNVLNAVIQTVVQWGIENNCKRGEYG